MLGLCLWCKAMFKMLFQQFVPIVLDTSWTERCACCQKNHLTAMELLCVGHAIAMKMPCNRHAFASYVTCKCEACLCHASAMQWPCCCCTIAMHFLYICYAVAMLSPNISTSWSVHIANCPVANCPIFRCSWHNISNFLILQYTLLNNHIFNGPLCNFLKAGSSWRRDEARWARLPKCDSGCVRVHNVFVI